MMLFNWKTYTVPNFSLKEVNTHNYGFVVCFKSVPISSFCAKKTNKKKKKIDPKFMS